MSPIESIWRVWLDEIIEDRVGPVHRMSTRSGATLLITDALVIKVHRAGTDLAALADRMAAVRATPDLWVPPAHHELRIAPDGRPATLWPKVAVVDPSGTVPWAEAGALLAALHRQPVTGLRLPTHDRSVRLRRARQRLVGSPYEITLGQVGDRLLTELAAAPTRSPVLVHGDWHLGQLGQMGQVDPVWRLLDLDDLALGDPEWDLARPAGWWAAGLLPDEDWNEFRLSYRQSSGAVWADGWSALDLPARWAVYLAACRAGNASGDSLPPEVATCLDICLKW
ncbi:MAG: hypothetical protein L0G99_07565 [Propionibacteriales bacterium]|nr:hypothetical protein [Propionibacteriales bacterium]